MQKIQKLNQYQGFITMGKIGHFPLFFSEWLNQSTFDGKKVSFRKAGHTVKHTFKLLERHNTIEKKKTALIGMDRITREEFIRSFLKVVEHESLKEVKTLQ